AGRAHHHRRQDHRTALMHPPSGPAWAVWLETSPVAVAMRQWLWLYPGVGIVHIGGFVLLVGSAFMFDLLLLGLLRALPVSAMAGHLLRWARLALLLVIPSGTLMFVAHAPRWPATRPSGSSSC